MADLPIVLDDVYGDRLKRALDVEGKVARALDALGPVAGRDVGLVDGGDGWAARLAETGASVRRLEWDDTGGLGAEDESLDVVVACWSTFRGVDTDEQAEVDRVLRPGGRLLVVHDYGRDDVSRLRGDLPEYGTWGRRSGPFLGTGFRIRVVHCWWTFESLEDAREFLAGAFGEIGRSVGEGLRRPRLSYNIAIYHRSRDGRVGTRPSVGAEASRQSRAAMSGGAAQVNVPVTLTADEPPSSRPNS